MLRTNSKLPTLEVAMRYRELWKVEQIFRTTKAVLETRPVYHASDAAIRGHLFCSFLALVLRKELQDRLQAAELDVEWQDVIADLDRVVETTVEQQGRRFVLRNQAPGFCWISVPGRWCRPAAPVPTPGRGTSRRAHRAAQPETPQTPPHTPQA